MRSKIDLIVFCGDYFDYKLSLNSKAALLAVQWMYEVVRVAKKSDVKKIRVIKGTEDHDNNQLEVFRELETEDEFFKIFVENTVEETLPSLKCIYCPDENINWKDYEERYMTNLMSTPDIGFFHGSFDIVLPDIVVQQSEETSARSVVYNFSTLAHLIKGPLISAHWHDPFDEEPLHYIGSYDAWEHGEQNIKGFAVIDYNTSDNGYHYHRFINPLAIEYRTIYCDSRILNESDDYTKLIDQVKQLKVKVPGIMIRILLTISDDNPKTHDYIDAVRHAFINDRTIKIVIKDMIKRAARKKAKEEVSKTSDEYSFVFEKIPITQKIQEYILVRHGKELSIDLISKYLKPYLDK